MEDIRLIISLTFQAKCSIVSIFVKRFHWVLSASFNGKGNFFTLVIKLIHLKFSNKYVKNIFLKLLAETLRLKV